jgi:iron complex transport system substrate-binding protein
VFGVAARTREGASPVTLALVGAALDASLGAVTAGLQQKKVVEGNLWKDLSAVKAGKSYDVPAEVWMTGIGVTAANKILDDIQSHLITA